MDANRRTSDERQAQRIEALGSLAGGLAHQFNELLTTIIGYAEIAREEAGENATLRSALEQISAAGQRASSLTHNLLAFGKPRKAQLELLDVNQNVRSIQSVLQHMLHNNVRFITVLEPALWPAMADREAIEEAITHLLANGRDAMPNGGALTVETANVRFESGPALPVSTPGEYVMIAISDTGCGLDEETAERLFEPFFTTKKEGTGLGLAAVHAIVKQHDGSVVVESKPGEGTVFRIYLPRAADARAGEMSTFTGLRETRQPGPVLLVDDDPAVRRLTCEILRREGHSVVEAANGHAALATLKQHDVDFELLVTDLKMPGMSGYELAQRVRRLSPATRVLFISGFPEQPDSELNDGQTRLLVKPFTVRDFLQKVQEVFEAPIEMPIAPPEQRQSIAS